MAYDGLAQTKIVHAFIEDHPEYDGPAKGVLGILKDLNTIVAFLEWCEQKGYLAVAPGDAAIMAIQRLQWDAEQDALLCQWAAERPEMAGADYEPGSPDALQQDIAFLRWKIDKGLTPQRVGTQTIQSLERRLLQLRDDATG
jgi:hypothetical protein